MIIEALIGGITVCFVSALVFANTMIKRHRAWELEDERPTPIPPPPPEPEPEPIIYPFVDLRPDNVCPKCLTKAVAAYEDDDGDWHEAVGPNLAKACKNYSCSAKKYPHLHACCNTCGCNWFMEPADNAAILKKTNAEDILNDIFTDSKGGDQ